ncbi:MAG: DUF4433 domain-containing protein [Candidatus Cloacimonetes bacterium]|nr:DUF4433 domain-containing protein [Candidatus Cloacimonadota bacterium]
MIDFYNIKSFGDIAEFHNIMPLVNIPSVLQNGILSNKKAEKIIHKSIAMNEIQKRRSKVQVPNGLYLHEYSNLYLHARNPMLYVRNSEEICILRIGKSICDLQKIVFADRNASSDYVVFLSKDQVNLLDYKLIFAQNWTDDNQFEYFEKKSKKCAELLIPDKIDSKYILGAYVINEKVKEKLQKLGFVKMITVNKEIFF